MCHYTHCEATFRSRGNLKIVQDEAQQIEKRQQGDDLILGKGYNRKEKEQGYDQFDPWIQAMNKGVLVG